MTIALDQVRAAPVQLPAHQDGPIPLVLAAASRFAAALQALPGVCQSPDPVAHLDGSCLDGSCLNGPGHDLRWRNVLLSGPCFRRAHVEELSVPGRLVVLHVCIFPHLDDPAPVFGFDLVGGPARVTGMFMDFSPVLAEPPAFRLGDRLAPGEIETFGERRLVPPWGDIFSADFVAVRPRALAEVAKAIAFGETALAAWLDNLDPGGAAAERERISTGQRRYAVTMRQNPHTFRMLAGLIGADAARRFIDDVLFPGPEAA